MCSKFWESGHLDFHHFFATNVLSDLWQDVELLPWTWLSHLWNKGTEKYHNIEELMFQILQGEFLFKKKKAFILIYNILF